MKQQPFSLSEDEIENICLKSEGNKIKNMGEQAAWVRVCSSKPVGIYHQY